MFKRQKNVSLRDRTTENCETEHTHYQLVLLRSPLVATLRQLALPDSYRALFFSCE